MIDRAAKIKMGWRLSVTICITLGVLGLIPALVDYQAFWPWVPFGSIATWLIAWALFQIGKEVTGRPLRRPRIR